MASCASRVSVSYNGPAERAYCSTTFTHATPVTITGNATYQTRAYTTSSGLSTSLTSRNIRHAEIVVTDSAGNIVQCGETDSSGAFSLQLPQSSSSHSIQIFSRGDSSTVKASVLNCPEENGIYSVSTSVVPDSSKSAGTITASSDNSGIMVGAAFNIFDQIVEANNFLRTQAGSCTYSGCTAFTVAPKVLTYWQKGYNPNTYFDPQGSGVSFYIPGLSRMFILGGENGDIFNSDTDHFDNSIVIHEYGHFLEDVFSNTDSPGGPHSGNSEIDPRLAWSEGWGNFIQAAVRNEDRYRDSFGTPDTGVGSTSSYIFNIQIESNPAPGCSIGSTIPGCDVPQFDYEGVFREFAVTRYLWDLFDTPNDSGSDTVTSGFSELWGAMTSSTFGLRKSNLEFRNLGILNLLQDTTGAQDWSSVQTLHKTNNDTAEYAQFVTPSGTCSYLLDPYTNGPLSNGSYSTSLVRNSDFFHFKHTGGSATFTLRATTTLSTAKEPDIDIYLYSKGARIDESSDLVALSENYWDNNAATSQTETMSVANLAAGDYLIHVRIFTGRYQLDNSLSTTNCIGSGPHQICEDADNVSPFTDYVPPGSQTNYEIEFNGADLCPGTL